MKQCWNNYKYANQDQCIATIDEFTTFKQMIKTVRLNITVNNALKIMDTYQKDDMLLNIHNEINDLFVNELIDISDDTVNRTIDQNDLSNKYNNAKSQVNSTFIPE